MSASSDPLRQTAKRIRLLGLDVDGVLTNGDIIYTDAGEEIKVFNVKDGHGIAMLIHFGISVAIITGRNSPIVAKRARELGVTQLYQGIKNKLPVLEGIAGELGITLDEVAYIGDDTPDMPILEKVGLSICPADAVLAVRQICDIVTSKPGGKGAVREVVDMIRQAQHAPPIPSTLTKS